MYAFDYACPRTIDEAIDLLRSDVEPRLLAGGQTLLPAMKHRLTAHSTLIDLQCIEDLRSLSAGSRAITIGAMTRHAEVAANAEIRSRIPALSVLASGIADPLVRNMGTIGGSVANNDPAADYPAAVLGLGATIVTDRRRIPADDYFTGMFSTVLEKDEVLTAISFPVPRRAGYFKLRQPASGYVMVGAFVADFGDRIRVAINGAGPCVFRSIETEAVLAHDFSLASMTLDFDPAELNEDLHASARYRSQVTPNVIRRAIAAALDFGTNTHFTGE